MRQFEALPLIASVLLIRRRALIILPITLGRDKGIFLAEGIDLQMILVASTIQVAALTTGDIDFSGAQSQVMAGAARGLAVKVVGFLTIKPSFWLMAKPEIKSMAELKNKIIGITAIGSSTDTLARFLVSKNGLTPDRGRRVHRHWNDFEYSDRHESRYDRCRRAVAAV